MATCNPDIKPGIRYKVIQGNSEFRKGFIIISRPGFWSEIWNYDFTEFWYIKNEDLMMVWNELIVEYDFEFAKNEISRLQNEKLNIENQIEKIIGTYYYKNS